MVHALQNAAHIGAARAYQLTLKTFGKDSPEVLSLRTFRSNQWKSDFAYLFLQWFSSVNAYVLNGGLFSIDDLMATIKDVLVTAAPKKSPIGTALPIHYIP
jgi:hypothetical protein